MMRDRKISCTTEDLASGQKSIFRWLNRMRFHFDHESASEREDSLNTALGFERCQREQKVANVMAVRQSAIDEAPVHTVQRAFFPTLEGEVSPHEGSGW